MDFFSNFIYFWFSSMSFWLAYFKACFFRIIYESRRTLNILGFSIRIFSTSKILNQDFFLRPRAPPGGGECRQAVSTGYLRASQQPFFSPLLPLSPVDFRMKRGIWKWLTARARNHFPPGGPCYQYIYTRYPEYFLYPSVILNYYSHNLFIPAK